MNGFFISKIPKLRDGISPSSSTLTHPVGPQAGHSEVTFTLNPLLRRGWFGPSALSTEPVQQDLRFCPATHQTLISTLEYLQSELHGISGFIFHLTRHQRWLGHSFSVRSATQPQQRSFPILTRMVQDQHWWDSFKPVSKLLTNTWLPSENRLAVQLAAIEAWKFIGPSANPVASLSGSVVSSNTRSGGTRRQKTNYKVPSRHIPKRGPWCGMETCLYVLRHHWSCQVCSINHCMCMSHMVPYSYFMDGAFSIISNTS